MIRGVTDEALLDEVKQQLVITVARAALLLDTTPEVLYNRTWRARVGLRAVKIGRSTRFRVEDLLRLIERGTESFVEDDEPGVRT
jgi:hypothetical protein